MYIQLSLPYRNFDKAGIKAVNFTKYEDDRININFNYFVYRETGSNKQELFSKNVNVVEQESKTLLQQDSNSSFNVLSNLDKVLLDYMIRHGIETGTIEVL